MRFSEPTWLLGTGLALLVAAFSIWGGVHLLHDVKRFGLPDAVSKLMTAQTGARRALKAALLVVAVALLFVALAGPQYGQGTRLIPATSLDCVIVLDYSKSMFARDVAPNRSERAKAEVSRLIQELPGARFGAVAFAGEPLSFPLTSDGGAIAQFFRQLTPNDMPVGGTAIARALESARELLDRDPLSAKHQKVIILITDGEDLEGNPVEVAKAANKQGILVHVVQIGGRAPEPIPEVNELGQVVGMRKDRSGKPLTTSLSSQGEEQLTQVATSGGGNIIRSETGQTGVEQITRSLKRFMTEELSERVETVYADVFHYPLILALVLLLVETFVPLARVRAKEKGALSTVGNTGVTLLILLSMNGCSKVDEHVFTRYSPDVDQAVANLESKDAGDAHQGLSSYLSTGKCKAGEIGTPQSLRERPFAAYDLGLALFDLAERFGGRLGEPPPKQDDPNAAATLSRRSQEVDCALRITRLIAHDNTTELILRAKAFFLSGNLELLRHDYKNAVESYDEALRLMPGGVLTRGTTNSEEPDFGADAAFNRALALKLAEEQEKNKPKPPDAGPPPQPDGGQNSDQTSDQQNSSDQGSDSRDEQNSNDQESSGDQSGSNSAPRDTDGTNSQDQDTNQGNNGSDQTSGEDAPTANSAPQPTPAPAASQPAERPSLSQDERMLDALERAPMFQPLNPAQVKGRAGRLEDK
jgi:Ca-activated chloride channel homolog